MITASSAWTNEAARDGAEPVVVVQFENAEYDSNQVTLATHEFADMPTGTLDILGQEISYTVAVDPLVGIPSVSAYNFSIIDRDGVFTTIIKENPQIYKDILFFYVGFKSINFSDFIALPRALIQNVQMDADLITYIVDATEFILGIKRNVFRQVARTYAVAEDSGTFTAYPGYPVTINTSVVKSDSRIEFSRVSAIGTPTIAPHVTSITEGTSFTVEYGANDESEYEWRLSNNNWLTEDIYVEDTNSFFAPTDSTAGYSTILPLAQIGDEIIKYDTLGANFIADCKRGYFETEQREIRSGDEVKQFFQFWFNDTESPGENLLHLLLTTGAGTNGYFDEGIQNFGAEINKADVDELQIVDEFNKYCVGRATGNVTQSNIYALYLAGDKIDLLSYIENVVFAVQKPVFMFMGGNNKIKMTLPNELYDTAVLTLTEDDIEHLSFEIRHDEFYNSIRVSPPSRLADGIFSGFAYEEAISQNNFGYGRSEYYEVELPQGSLGTDRRLFHRLIQLYRKPSIDVSVAVKWEKMLIEIGDVIAITYPNLPSFSNETWQGYVVEKRIDFLGSINYIIKCFNAFGDLDTNRNIDIVEEADFDEATITLNADFSVTVQASDGYYDNTTNAYDGQFFLVELAFTPPGTATTTYKRMDIAIGLIDTGVYDTQKNFEVLYDPSSSIERTVYLEVEQNNGGNIIADAVKIDWFASDADVADRPTSLTWKKLTIVKTDLIWANITDF